MFTTMAWNVQLFPWRGLDGSLLIPPTQTVVCWVRLFSRGRQCAGLRPLPRIERSRSATRIRMRAWTTLGDASPFRIISAKCYQLWYSRRWCSVRLRVQACIFTGTLHWMIIIACCAGGFALFCIGLLFRWWIWRRQACNAADRMSSWHCNLARSMTWRKHA